jgi:CRISPR/Cas system CSM-associated protein Csm4 (group 5 of RAMP superfamily)
MRWNAAVDRLSGSSERHSVGCIEFRAGSGLWTVVSFADEAARDRWSDQLKAAFRLLADSGLGGERSRGWGRSEAPEFVEGELPGMILAPVNESEEKGIGAGGGDSGKDADASSLEPPAAVTLEPEPASEGGEAAIENQKAAEGDLPPAPTPNPHPLFSSSEAAPRSASPHWLLSLYSPAPSDSVDWRRGNYTVLSRGGRIESPARWGELKKQLHMISEGSVIYAPAPPRGAAPDVAPAGFAHPVFRAGFAVSIPLPEAS